MPIRPLLARAALWLAEHPDVEPLSVTIDEVTGARICVGREDLQRVYSPADLMLVRGDRSHDFLEREERGLTILAAVPVEARIRLAWGAR